MAKIGSYREMLADEAAGLKDFTKNGECSGCGNCCANFLPISDVEIRRIQAYMVEHGITEQVCRFPTAVPTVDVTCPFRDDVGKRCTIYEVRPAICRDFRCDKAEEAKINKSLYHGKYGAADMRAVFFGRESTIARVAREVFGWT